MTNAKTVDCIRIASLGLDRERVEALGTTIAKNKSSRCDADADFAGGHSSSNAFPRHWGFVIDSSFVVRHWAFLVGVLLVLGCGSQTGPQRIAVYGTVSRSGKSVQQGSISFLPAEGHTGPAANGAISGGKYSFSTENGPSAGPHHVVVRVALLNADSKKATSSAPQAKPAGKNKKAASPTQREFDVTVSEEDRERNFEIE